MTGATVRVTGDVKVKDTLNRLAKAMTPEAIDKVVDRAGLETHAVLVQATPKRWFGQVRKSWAVQKPESGVRIVRNDNKVMLFLEEGTKAHGPKEIYGPLIEGQKRQKNFLFVPIRQEAAGGWKPSLKFGVDYLLLKRVRGIRARHIVRTERPRAQARLKNGMKALVKTAIAGGSNG